MDPKEVSAAEKGLGQWFSTCYCEETNLLDFLPFDGISGENHTNKYIEQWFSPLDHQRDF
jgi:hypothetical protein